jgi:energy-coupling factor transport system substrate-specific component
VSAVTERVLPSGQPSGTRRHAVRFGRRSSVLLAVVSLLGLAAFSWPFLIRAEGTEDMAHATDAPWIFVLLLPLLLAIVLAELAEGALDAKAVALLGVLAACGSALRLPGGVAGFEPLFFLLLPAGRVLGRGFGFVLGALTLFASALVTGGVGPWLPFQMLAAGWVGFFAGCLPPARGRREVVLLAAYGFVAGLAYGFLMNLWFWPFGSDAGSQVAFVFGAPLAENLRRYWGFYLATSLGWDLFRAVGTAALVLVAGRPVLNALGRVARRAAFGAPVQFEPARSDPARALASPRDRSLQDVDGARGDDADGHQRDGGLHGHQ